MGGEKRAQVRGGGEMGRKGGRRRRGAKKMNKRKGRSNEGVD